MMVDSLEFIWFVSNKLIEKYEITQPVHSSERFPSSVRVNFLGQVILKNGSQKFVMTQKLFHNMNHQK